MTDLLASIVYVPLAAFVAWGISFWLVLGAGFFGWMEIETMTKIICTYYMFPCE